MTRPTDAIKETRSYTIFRTSDGTLKVKASHFAPGYTVAHQPTKVDAVRFALMQAEGKLIETDREIDQLNELLDSVI